MAISFARLQEKQLNHEAQRTRVTPQPAISKPSSPSIVIRAPAPKKLTREELWERFVKGLYWHYDESSSLENRCKKGRLLMIEPVEEEFIEPSEESLEHKEVMKEEPQPPNFTVHALTGYSNPQESWRPSQTVVDHCSIDTGSTNNFLNSKDVARMALHIEGCNKFDVKVIDGQILKYDQRCSRVKLLLQDQEIIVDFFLLPIDNYEAVLGIEWLTMLRDIS
ncbi:hypothetical protein B296_00037578 [Ensete ventricosum]|uniref:Uncharacterized protein n=1 Tax=Ensete ventricosum TaxID=4639 RepID=A0A426ZS94_ENSVE|nr:hypothetical protein B296_00037578 [Ensete ventricosum]